MEEKSASIPEPVCHSRILKLDSVWGIYICVCVCMCVCVCIHVCVCVCVCVIYMKTGVNALLIVGIFCFPPCNRPYQQHQFLVDCILQLKKYNGVDAEVKGRMLRVAPNHTSRIGRLFSWLLWYLNICLPFLFIAVSNFTHTHTHNTHAHAHTHTRPPHTVAPSSATSGVPQLNFAQVIPWLSLSTQPPLPQLLV